MFANMCIASGSTFTFHILKYFIELFFQGGASKRFNHITTRSRLSRSDDILLLSLPMTSAISRLVQPCPKCSRSASVILRMDNLLFAMWSPKKKLRECHGYPARYVTIFTVQFALEYAVILKDHMVCIYSRDRR